MFGGLDHLLAIYFNGVITIFKINKRSTRHGSCYRFSFFQILILAPKLSKLCQRSSISPQTPPQKPSENLKIGPSQKSFQSGMRRDARWELRTPSGPLWASYFGAHCPSRACQSVISDRTSPRQLSERGSDRTIFFFLVHILPKKRR